jgi:hypothetical protein
MFPQRESLDSLRRTREDVGEYTFLSPVPAGTRAKGRGHDQDWLSIAKM